MELIHAVKDGFKNYTNTKITATRSQLYYWFLFALISITLFNLIDIVIFDSNTYSQLFELNEPTGWLSRIWFWSIVTPSITIIIRRIKVMPKPVWKQRSFVDILTMVVILMLMLLILAY
ncbi:MAG: hypothetical protein CL761_03045 [Chloroflexi bacterium]|nr:hypothetical protein [Chloroflexota bacterium]|tara:strand:+ start:89 stop:445 length:357 start_codon:yes stop_codon:yes gene_type:complete